MSRQEKHTHKEEMNWAFLFISAGMGAGGIISGLLYIYGSSDLPGSESIGNDPGLLLGSILLLAGGIGISRAGVELEEMRIKEEDSYKKPR